MMFVAIVAGVITLPALIEVNFGTEEAPIILPMAFYAVVSVAVIGLYLAFAIPIYLRWRHGDDFEVGAWTNGAKYKWMNPIAVAEIVIISLYFMPAALPVGLTRSTRTSSGSSSTTHRSSRSARLLLLTIWWQASAKNWFTGPKHTIDEAVVEAFDD